jgi:hypothetical protein
LYTPRTERDVIGAFGEIGGKIREGYTLGYVSTNTAHDGSYRKLIVRVLAPGMRAPVRARARRLRRAEPCEWALTRGRSIRRRPAAPAGPCS